VNVQQQLIWDAVKAVGQGVWFSVPVIALRSGVSVQTVRKYLKQWEEAGVLRCEIGEYRPHIKQALYMVMEDE
jgi:ribosomal protein S25